MVLGLALLCVQPIAGTADEAREDRAGNARGAGDESDVPPALDKPVANADAVRARLDDFITKLATFSADFEQTLYDENSEPLQSSSGNLRIKRPGKFFWRYEKPDRQDIVADGKVLWLYDHELEQVTVSPVDERLSGTPLVLLTGGTPLGEQFEIEALGASEGIDWLELTPRETGSDFEQVYIGLDEQGVIAMELQDSFGQATQIRFSNAQSNRAIDDDVFAFTPPDGVDVIGDMPR